MPGWSSVTPIFTRHRIRFALTKTLLIILLGICLPACHHQNTRVNQLITEAEALKIATNAFEQLGYGPIENYSATISDEYEEGIWSVFFDGKGQYTLRHAFIDVMKDSGEFKIYHGE